ncbi:MAG: sugar phosphate nucleotidyltransferase [Candidatus Kapabacteria bacterium]|nr:sugar phosphate nucleotidyltransferase [Candidatus Kapabacteria bacterium]MDW8225107.1 sugar phosphate nucleotidyltransferase [Bacteroidota bacterium]
MSLRALIPVAGAGTRLRPLTYAVPKSLLTVADKPIVGHILDGLQSAGIEEVVLIVGYKGDQLVEYVRNAYPTLKLHWVVQTEAQGLGHAVWCARDYLDGRPAVIVLGDTLVELEWERFLGLPQNAVGVKQVEDPRRFGVITLQDGVVTGFVEKPENPPSDLALVGLYLILDTLRLREALEELLRRNLRTRGEYQLTDALELMRQSGSQFYPLRVQTWYDCGKVETLLETNRHLLHRRANNPELPHCAVIPPIYVAPTARVEYAVVGPYAAIADGAVVRHCIIRDSIVNAGAYLEAVLVEHSVIGARSTLRGSFQRVSLCDDSRIQ